MDVTTTTRDRAPSVSPADAVETYEVDRETLAVGAILMFHSWRQRAPDALLIVAIRHSRGADRRPVSQSTRSGTTVARWADDLVVVDNLGRERTLCANYVRNSRQYRRLVTR